MFREEKGSSPAVESFIKAQASIFEIKKILKNIKRILFLFQ